MEAYYQDKINGRQELVYNHLKNVLGAKKQGIHYYKSKMFFYEMSSVDYVIFEPTEKCPYIVVSTVGLSAFKKDVESIRGEIMLVLDPTWRIDFKDANFYWPFKLLREVVDKIKDYHTDYSLYSYFGDNDKTFNGLDKTNYVGGILTLPELLPSDIISCGEENKQPTYFFQLMPFTRAQLSKIEEVGGKNFVEYDLHDADGAQLVIVNEQKQGKKSNIDKIIDHNNNSLLDE